MPALEDEESDVESRLSVLASTVERLTEELKEVTQELRRTNESVQAQQTEARLVRERVDQIGREIWDRYNTSRVQSLELHVKGLYALVGFLVLTVAGRLAPVVYHFITNGN